MTLATLPLDVDTHGMLDPWVIEVWCPACRRGHTCPPGRCLGVNLSVVRRKNGRPLLLGSKAEAHAHAHATLSGGRWRYAPVPYDPRRHDADHRVTA